MNLQPATADKPGVYKASLSKSFEAMLQQPNPTTQMVTPPWAVLKIADNVIFRFGSVIQPTYEALQDQNSGGYSQNFYLRRARFSVLANLPENITVFFQTDDPRVGYSGTNGQKNINSGFLIQDAYAQWNFLGHAMAVQAGLFLIPTERQVLTSVSTFLALDLPTWSQQQGTIEEANGGRDYGVGLNGALLGDHLTYRTGIFDGYRAPTSPQEPPLGPAAGAPQLAVFRGTPPVRRVRHRVRLRLRRHESRQEEGRSRSPASTRPRATTRATAATSSATGRSSTEDAVTVEADYIHYDGHDFTFNDNGTNNTLPEQYSLYANAGFYFCNAEAPALRPLRVPEVHVGRRQHRQGTAALRRRLQLLRVRPELQDRRRTTRGSFRRCSRPMTQSSRTSTASFCEIQGSF